VNRPSAALGVFFATILSFTQCTSAANPQPPPQAQPTRAAALEQLVRGSSTRADVERLLGHAQGVGGARLPPSWLARDVWFYEAVTLGKMNPEYRPPNQKFTSLHVDMAQDILLVFFAGDLFDGYLWYSSDIPSQVRAPQ